MCVVQPGGGEPALGEPCGHAHPELLQRLPGAGLPPVGLTSRRTAFKPHHRQPFGLLNRPMDLYIYSLLM